MCAITCLVPWVSKRPRGIPGAPTCSPEPLLPGTGRPVGDTGLGRGSSTRGTGTATPALQLSRWIPPACQMCRQMTPCVFYRAQPLPGFSFFCVFSSVQFPVLLFFLHNSFFLSSLGNLPGTLRSSTHWSSAGFVKLLLSEVFL